MKIFPISSFRLSISLTLFLSLVLLIAICEGGGLRKQKKVRCHPKCCQNQKPKKPKSLLGRYMLDVADASENGQGEDIFDLVYVLIKTAKGTYNDYQLFGATKDGLQNATNSHQEYRFGGSFNEIMSDVSADQRSAVRTRYAPGNGVADSVFGGMTSMFFPPGGRTQSSIWRLFPQPQVNLDTQTFFGLNVSTQAAVAVSIKSFCQSGKSNWWSFIFDNGLHYSFL